jgi:hypothetical protein
MFLLPVARALGSSLLLPSLLLYIATSYCRSPYFKRKATMQQLQAEFPEQYAATSGHRFRAGDDMQFASAYKWYAAHIWASNYDEHQQQQQQQRQQNTASESFDAIQFVMLQDNMVETGRCEQLSVTWSKPGVKFVCLNDSANDPRYLPEINRQTVQFLSAQHPEPSVFELPEGVSNGCSYLTASYGSLPSKQDIAAACGLPQLS